jgi:hypothetical protein
MTDSTNAGAPFPEGEWSGFFAYDDGTRHGTRQSFARIGDALHGTGSDGLGDYELSGTLKSDGAVQWCKRYTRAKAFAPAPDLDSDLVIDVSGNRIDYQGRWDGECIRGTWTLRGNEGSGGFELRPGPGHEPSLEASRAKNYGDLVLKSETDEDFPFCLLGVAPIYVGLLDGQHMWGHKKPDQLHATFFFIGERLAVQAGELVVRVNGVAVGAEPRVLETGDEIVIGRLRFVAELS